MPLTTEEQALIIKVLGTVEVERLTEQLAKEEATLRALTEAKAKGLITDAAYEVQAKRTTSSMLTNQAALDKTKNSLRGYSENIRGLGYVFNDFFSVSGNLTQRLNAIANNMPMLLAGFGGWGLALSGLMPIVGALIPMIDRLAKSLGFGDSEKLFNSVIDNLKLKIKELEDNPAKIGADTTELDAAKAKLETLTRALAAFEAAKRTATEEDLAAQAGKAVHETMGSEGFEKAVFESTKVSGDVSMVPQEIIDSIREGPKRIKAEKEAAAAADSPEAAQAHERQAELIKEEIADATKAFDKKLHEHAKAVVGSFLTGDVGSIAQIYNLTQATPGAFDKTTREAVAKIPRTGEQVAEVRQGARDQAKESKEIDRAREFEKKAREAEEERVDRVEADRAQRMATQRAAFDANRAKIREEMETPLTTMAEEGKARRDPTTQARMQARALTTGGLDPKAAEDAAFVVVRDIMKAVEQRYAAKLPEPDEAKGPVLRDLSKLKGLELRKARRQNAQAVETRRRPKGAMPALKGLALRAQQTRLRKQAAEAKKSKMAFPRMGPEEQRDEMMARAAAADLVRKQQAAKEAAAKDLETLGGPAAWQQRAGRPIAQPGADLNPMRPMAAPMPTPQAPPDSSQAVSPLMNMMGTGNGTTSALAGGLSQLAAKFDVLARQQAMARQDTQRALKMVGQAGETALNMGGPGS